MLGAAWASLHQDQRSRPLQGTQLAALVPHLRPALRLVQILIK
jgi:hypothetical protein